DFGHGFQSPSPAGSALADLDLDLSGLHFLDLREPDLEDAIPVGGANLVRLHRDRQLDVPLEGARPSLDPVIVLFAHLAVGTALAAQRQDLADDGETNILFLHSRELDRHDELILRLVHIERGSPGALGGAARLIEVSVEGSAEVLLDLGQASERVEARKVSVAP